MESNVKSHSNKPVRVSKDEALLAVRGILLALTSESAQPFLTDEDCSKMEDLLERLAAAIGINGKLVERVDKAH